MKERPQEGVRVFFNTWTWNQHARAHIVVWNQRRWLNSQEGNHWRRAWPGRPDGRWRRLKVWPYPKLRNIKWHSLGLIKLCKFQRYIGIIHWVTKEEFLRVIITFPLGLGRNRRVGNFWWQHLKLTKHGRFFEQNNQLPTKIHDELKDNSIVKAKCPQNIKQASYEGISAIFWRLKFLSGGEHTHRTNHGSPKNSKKIFHLIYLYSCLKTRTLRLVQRNTMAVNSLEAHHSRRNNNKKCGKRDLGGVGWSGDL